MLNRHFIVENFHTAEGANVGMNEEVYVITLSLTRFFFVGRSWPSDLAWEPSAPWTTVLLGLT